MNNILDLNKYSKVLIPASEVAAKVKSKRKVYRFVSCELKAYVSSFETMTVWHLRDLMDSKKKRIHVDDVKHINIPNFDGLTIETMMDYAKQTKTAMNYFPVKEELKKLPR